jgi:beta-D-xylosidase 4
MHSLSALVLLGAALVSTTQAAIGPDCVNGPLKANKICDKTASASERAAALVAAMQTSEKLDNLMRCVLKPMRGES